jgi:hypothetical protein
LGRHSSATGEILSDTVMTPVRQAKSSSILTQTSDERRDWSTKCLEQVVHDDLISVKDMALNAASRLVVQAMIYGGGEASTGVWRSVITSLSDDSYAQWWRICG